MEAAYTRWKAYMDELEILKQEEKSADKVFAEVQAYARDILDVYSWIRSCLNSGAQGCYIWNGADRASCLEKVAKLHRDMLWLDGALKDAFDEIKQAIIDKRIEFGQLATEALNEFGPLDWFNAYLNGYAK